MTEKTTNGVIIAVAVIVILIVAFAGYSNRYYVAHTLTPDTTATSTDMTTASTTSMMATTTAAAPTTASVSTQATSSSSDTSHLPVAGGAADYILHVGQTLTASGISVTLLSVDDNRCAIDANCSQSTAGTLKANLRIQKGSFSTTQTMSLGLPVTVGGYTSTLVSALPDREVNKSIPQSSYKLDFRVTAQ